MDDCLYMEYVKYHTDSERKYPDSFYELDPEKRTNAKSNFRRTAKPFHVVDGILMYGKQEVLVKSRLASILHAYHDNPTKGGHFGRDKTYFKINERFYWHGMKAHIAKYVQKCKKCFAVNSKISKEAAPLNSIQVPTKCWSLIGIDFIGPLQETTNGMKYIVAATDHFTKYSHAAAIPDKTALSVAKFIFDMICMFGCMDHIITDQGREFVNKINSELTELLQTEHRITSAYHPQSNGQREKDNRTLKDALCKQVNDEGDNWDKFIPGVLFAYHTSVHASTKKTPFEVMYGRKAKLPLDRKSHADIAYVEATLREITTDEPTLGDGKTSSDAAIGDFNAEAEHSFGDANTGTGNANGDPETCTGAVDDYAEDSTGDIYCNADAAIGTVNQNTLQSLVNIRKGLHNEVEENIKAAQKRQKENYDRRHDSSKTFDVGARVSIKNSKRIHRMGSKMTPRFIGDYIVVKCFGKGRVQIKNNISGQILKTLYNITNLKLKLHDDEELSADDPVSQDVPVETKDEEVFPFKKQQDSRKFKLPQLKVRKNLATMLGLKNTKTVKFGRTGALRKPSSTYKTLGDGNCYFRSISYILTGSEDGHLIVCNQVTNHMLEVDSKLT